MKRLGLPFCMLALLAATAAFAQTAQPPAPREEAPEAEALRALEKALTRRGSYAANGFLRRLDTRDFGGCKVMYDLTPQAAPDHVGFVPFAERTTVNLSALDPTRVAVKAGRRGASISFAARADSAVIERQLGQGPHGFGEVTRLSSAYIYVPSREGAEEVRAALVRAIEACAK